MDATTLQRHLTARLLQGRPAPLVGRLLTGARADGGAVLLDPDTGGELDLKADDRPAFVMSTEGDATDRHVLRQHWDLSRAAEDGAGAPLLWNHNADVLLGQWQDVRVREMDGGPQLVGRAWFDPEDELAVKRRGQVQRRVLKACSVRWAPGALVRRGELDESDPLYREPEDDVCDQPAEGFVMGTQESPNLLIECSLTPTPADPRAVLTERLYRGAEDTLSRYAGPRAASAADLDSLLALLASDARVQRWASRQFSAFLAGDAGEAWLRAWLSSPSGSALLRDLTAPPPAPPKRTVADLFPRK